MSDGLLAGAFAAATAVSLSAGWVLVSRLERVGARLGLSEGLLGMLAALAADSPEITAAVTAIARHQTRIGAGVVMGSNVLNLAALLGVASLVAGRIALHRRVIVLEGVVALWIAGACLAAVLGGLAPAVALALALLALLPYLTVLAMGHRRLARAGLPPHLSEWLATAVGEEELEIEEGIGQLSRGRGDALAALAAVAVVVGASVAMERTASTLAGRHSVPEIVTGALALAAVTSLPNAVAALYLAARGRGAATLSTAMNSNALNVVAGLLLPASIAGSLGASSSASDLLAASYAGLTAVALGIAYASRGLRRWHGALIVCVYLAFIGALTAVA